MFIGTTGRHFRPLLSPNGAGLTYSLTSQIPPSLKSLDSSPPPFMPHSPATYKPIIVAQRCSSALPGDTFRPLLSPNGAGLTYSLTSQIPPSLKSLDSSPPPFKLHSPATFKPIIVAQRCSSALPGNTYQPFCRPTVLLGTPGRHFRPLLSPNGAGMTYSLTSQIPPSLKSLDSSPPPFKPHSPATFKPIIVAQRCSSALPGDTYAYHRRPTVLLGTPGRHFRPLLSPKGTGLTYSLTSQIPPSLKSLDSSPPPFKPALSGDT